MLRGFAAVHVACEYSVLDQYRVLGRCSLVINEYRQRGGGAVRQCVGEVHHGDKLACNLFVEVMRGNRASEHKIRLNSVTDSLVRQYSRKVWVHNNVAVSGVSINTVCLLHDVFIQLVNAGEKFVRR